MHEKAQIVFRREHAVRNLVGSHPTFIRLVEKLQIVASKNISILLLGETGTGKGHCAEFIHQFSHHYNYPFIPYNCGTGPVDLFESQLFGHVKGAFTGATSNRWGLVTEADNGILFLDEINSLDMASQVKLNHFLETGCFRRVGENIVRNVDVRIIAASNTDLKDKIIAKRFREDLYYRLAEYEILVPPLRKRKEDISLLADYFLIKNAYLTCYDKLKLSNETLEFFEQYHWPGNIRQLENFIKKSIVDAKSNIIELSEDLKMSEFESKSEPIDPLNNMPWKKAKNKVVSDFEKKYLRSLLQKYHGNVAKCARHAGLRAPDFWKLLRKYNLSARPYRIKRL